MYVVSVYLLLQRVTGIFNMAGNRILLVTIYTNLLISDFKSSNFSDFK